MSINKRFLVPCLVATIAFGSLTYSHGQAGRPAPIGGPQIGRRNNVAAYHLVHIGSNTFRYNSCTGETQQLSITSQNVGVGYAWTAFNEASGAPAGGDPGRYEVAQGPGAGDMVRIDTLLGATWCSSSSGGVYRWDRVIQ